MLTYESDKNAQALSDIPCTKYDGEQIKALFLLWCLENVDHLDSDSEIDLLIEKVARCGKYAPGLISDSAATAFAATDKGSTIINKIWP